MRGNFRYCACFAREVGPRSCAVVETVDPPHCAADRSPGSPGAERRRQPFRVCATLAAAVLESALARPAGAARSASSPFAAASHLRFSIVGSKLRPAGDPLLTRSPSPDEQRPHDLPDSAASTDCSFPRGANAPFSDGNECQLSTGLAQGNSPTP